MRTRATVESRPAPTVEPRARHKPVRAEPPAPSDAEVLALLEVVEARIEIQLEKQRALEKMLGRENVRAVDQVLEMYLSPHTNTRARAAADAIAKVAARVQTQFERANRHLPAEWLRAADRILAARCTAAAERGAPDVPMSPQARARFRTQGWADEMPSAHPGLLGRTIRLVANSSGFQMATQMSHRLNTLSSFYLSQGYDRYLREAATIKRIEEEIQRKQNEIGRRGRDSDERRRQVEFADEMRPRIDALANTPGSFIQVDMTEDVEMYEAMLGDTIENVLGARRGDDKAALEAALRRVRADVRFARMAAFARENAFAQPHWNAMVVARKNRRGRYIAHFEERRKALASGVKDLSLRNYAEFGAGGGWQNALFQMTDYMNAQAPEFSLERRERAGWKKLVEYGGKAARCCAVVGNIHTALVTIEQNSFADRVQTALDNNEEQWAKAIDANKVQTEMSVAASKFETLVSRGGQSPTGAGSLTGPEVVRGLAALADAGDPACVENFGGVLCVSAPAPGALVAEQRDVAPKPVETFAETRARTGVDPAAGVIETTENGVLQNQTLTGRGGVYAFVQLLDPAQMAAVRRTDDLTARMEESEAYRAAMLENTQQFAKVTNDVLREGAEKARQASSGEMFADAIFPMESSAIMADAVLKEMSPLYRGAQGAYRVFEQYRGADEPDEQAQETDRSQAVGLLTGAMNMMGGGLDYMNFTPAFMRAAQANQTLWKLGKSAGTLWLFYKTLTGGGWQAIGWTVAHMAMLAAQVDARSASLYLLAGAALVAKPIVWAARYVAYLFGPADNPDEEIVLQKKLRALSAWGVRTYESFFGEIPSATYSKWARQIGAVRSAYNVALMGLGGMSYVATMITDMVAFYTLMGQVIPVLTIVVTSPWLLLGVGAAAAGGALTVAAVTSLSRRANDWYHKTMNAVFSVGAVLIERPDLTLLALRLTLQLVAGGQAIFGANGDYWNPNSRLRRALDEMGAAKYVFDMVSTLSLWNHPKFVFDYFVKTAQDEFDQSFMGLWNAAGKVTWPLVTATFPAEEERRKNYGLFRLLTCGVMAGVMERRKIPGGDDAFVRGCTRVAVYKNLVPDDI